LTSTTDWCGQPDLKLDAWAHLRGQRLLPCACECTSFVPLALPVPRMTERELWVMEPIVQRCVGIDIGEVTLKATLRVQGGPGWRTRREVRTFQTTTAELLELCDWVVDEQVSLVGMESTGSTGSRSTTCWKRSWTAGCSTPST
jgi:hypothetical protein